MTSFFKEGNVVTNYTFACHSHSSNQAQHPFLNECRPVSLHCHNRGTIVTLSQSILGKSGPRSYLPANWALANRAPANWAPVTFWCSNLGFRKIGTMTFLQGKLLFQVCKKSYSQVFNAQLQKYICTNRQVQHMIFGGKNPIQICTYVKFIY